MAKAGRLRVPVKLEAAGDTHIGGRTHNEDAILMRPDLNLFLVADGAGGQNAGNVASSLAITTIAHFFEQTQEGADKLPEVDALGLYTAARRLAAAVQEANKEILEIAKSSDKHRGMGTTIVAALFDLDHRCLHVAYVGDSRLYRLRDGRLEQLTHDHSLINDVLELKPNISDERVKRLPQNVITRALGMMDNLRVSVRSHEVVHGDRYLLCSDGLSDNVGDGQIHESLALDIDCDEQVALLVSMALEAGTSDNVAAVIVDCSLPHSSASTKASTRPIKKTLKRSSRPKLPRIDPGEARLTEESVPEIVLYDRPERRDSSPLIHVVPAASSSPDMVQAVQTVMHEEEQVTQEYASQLDPSLPDPTGGEPALRGITRDDELRAARDSLENQATKVMATDHAKLREVAGDLPDPAAADIDDELTVAQEPRPSLKPRLRPISKPPTKGKKGALATPRKISRPPARPLPAAPLPKAAPPRQLLGAATSNDGTERGGAAAAPPRNAESPRTAASLKPDKKVSAPRRQKRDSFDEIDEPRTGDTQAPPGSPDPNEASGSTHQTGPARSLVTKPTPATGSLFTRTKPRAAGPRIEPERHPTLQGPLPSEDSVEVPDRDGLPLPPVREPFDTSDFTNDSVPCHACGSIIMRTADLCMYCGAPTGFLVKKK